jgi:hypothetical protein
MDREGVDRAGQFVGESGIYHPVAFDPAFPGKGFGDDVDPEMRLAFGPVPGVTFVEMRLVDHRQTFRLERPLKLFLNSTLDRHDAAILFRHNDLP